MKKLFRILMLMVLPVLVSAADGGAKVEYKVGDRVEKFEAKDKNEVAYTFKKGTRYLMVSMDMKTGKKANKALDAKGAAYLGRKKAVYVANIYGMPGIGRMFALPKMKKYAHPIVLGDAEGLLDRFPTEKGKVTVLKLDKSGKIIGIHYWDPAVESVDDVLR